MKNENSWVLLIKQIHDTLEKNANNNLKPWDITLAQLNVLLALRNTHDKKLSLKELEKVLHVAQSTTARIVTKLESKGFVNCFGDASDKRIKYVGITPLGEQCCDNSEQQMEKIEESILSSLAEKEQTEFIRQLHKVKNSLN